MSQGGKELETNAGGMGICRDGVVNSQGETFPESNVSNRNMHQIEVQRSNKLDMF